MQVYNILIMGDPNSHRFDRKFVCVKYPGFVVNDDKMLETLGGIQRISSIFVSQNQRLGLNYRPDDPHSKAMYADREKVAGLLLKVRVPKKQSRSAEEATSPYSYSVLGCVTETYNFKSMCDFQYLPQTSGPHGEQECIIEQICPSDTIPPISWLNEANKHLFLLPPAMSRMDSPNPFCYRSENADIGAPVNPSSVIKSNRSSRKHFNQRITFDEKMVIPTAPLPAALKELKSKKIDLELLQRANKMFAARPVWSKVALQIECDKFTPHVMTYLLPCVAYYFMSGPWRLLWVRFGYNPRENPAARFYQLVDYRVQSLKLRSLVKARNRARNVHLPSKHQKCSRNRKTFITSELLQDVPTNSSSTKIKDVEAFYKFRKGLIPAHRNMLYQLIDVDIPEIKDALKTAPSPGTVCHERYGWLSSSFFERVRKLIDQEATATAISLFGQEKEEEEEVEAEAFADSSDSDGSSLVILSSSEGESEPEPEYEVDDESPNE
ncbi:UNVERIFIED_CONTAM: hypothetical protein B566_EDAN015877 [Ephemera danica]|nr:hypothetical protein B566_EDAN015877 [Ephemera danica]